MSKKHADLEHRLILGLVFGVISVFGLIFGLVFGFLFSFSSLFSLIFGFGTIMGVPCFLMLVDKHAQPHSSMPEASLAGLLLYSSLGVRHNKP